MIKAISNIDELNKIIRNQLILQSKLDGSKVLNSVSSYGQNLDKLLQAAEYTSVVPSDNIILFELTTRTSDSDVSYMLDDKIQYNKAYLVKVIIYGNDSSNIMNNLVGRFRTEKVRYSLQQEGVYLESIEPSGPLNEFKNDRMWIRNDCDINIYCRNEIDELNPSDDFESFTGLTVIVKEN